MPTDFLPRPLCFVAMPFGRRAPPGATKPKIDFDKVYETIKGAVEKAGLECLRADFDPSGGFIHRSMFEALLVAEYVIVDLTFANANVTYEVGLRHGANAGRGTILVCEQRSVGALPFDFRPFRAISYAFAKLDQLGESVRKRLKLATSGALPADNPILQVTAIRPSAVGHEKTDIFAQRMKFVSELGERVAGILRSKDTKKAVERLAQLESELLETATQVEQLHSSLIAIYLGYRAKKAWEHMTALYGKLPRELQESSVAREQLALAHNRIAEGLSDDTAIVEARRRAVAALEGIAKDKWTSETYGILGRIHKGRADAETKAGRETQAAAALSAAIEAYESGFRADPRDSFPGVNAVTLRILRAGPQDEGELAKLVPVVQFSVDRSPPPAGGDEAYWQVATKVELATAARAWPAAKAAFEKLLSLDVADWMRETTAGNLERQARARASEPESVQQLDALVAELRPPPSKQP
jgi:tetratricopeptide repeat protein